MPQKRQRVVIIYLVLPLPAVSSDPPESTAGSRIAFCSVLLRMGFTYARSVTGQAVVSYTALPPLLCCTFSKKTCSTAVHFCCTCLGVTSTGRYPASCPVKLRLSSLRTFRYWGARLPILLISNHIPFYMRLPYFAITFSVFNIFKHHL